MNKKIKAFTIIEVVISLAIMGIIISMVYSIYTILSKQLYSYNSETSQILSYSQFEMALRRDFYVSRDYNFKENKLILLKEDDTITYQIIEPRLIRLTAHLSDTLMIPISDFKIHPHNTSNLNNLEKISLNYYLLGEKINGFYFKDQGIASKVNSEIFFNGN